MTNKAKSDEAKASYDWVINRTSKSRHNYWPDESLPFGYAVAAVQVSLLRSEKANNIFNEVVKAYDLPGCQRLIEVGNLLIPDTLTWKERYFLSLQNKIQIPYWPQRWREAFDKYSDNPDFSFLISLVCNFINTAFNRKEDIEENTLKTNAIETPFLIMAVTWRALAEYSKWKLEDWEKYPTTIINGKQYDIDKIMQEKPTHRLAQQLRKLYHQYGWTLKHRDNMVTIADWWYQSRIIYSGPEQFCNETYKAGGPLLDPPYVIRQIAVVDGVIPGHRKWR
jgi:hypothetical protein